MTKRQKLVLVISILASLVAFLDGAIVNVALPAIQQELGGGLSVQQWVVDAYLLTLGSFILIAGSLSDLIGRKRILSLGLWGFGAASLLCAAAPNGTSLIIFRALQGMAGALLVPSSLALIISSFSGTAQAKAVGSWTAWTGIAFILGPLIGGFLVDAASWRWIFAINVFPIALTLVLMRRIEVKSDTKIKSKADIYGAVLCALGLGGPVFALIEQPRHGWGEPLIYLPLISGVILFGFFLVYESRIKNPMLPLSLFRNRNFSVGNVATLAIYAGLSTSTFLIVLFLQQVSGYSALKAGLALLPVTIIMFLLSSRFGAWSAKFGPRLFMGIGPLVAAAGFVMMTAVKVNTDYWSQLFPGIMVFGLGLAITVAPLTAAILGDVPQKQAGIASAVNNAVARIAGLVAIAAVGAVVAASFSASLDKNRTIAYMPVSDLNQIKQVPLEITPPKGRKDDCTLVNAMASASLTAYRSGIAAVAGLLAVGGIVSLVGIRNPKIEK